MDIKGWQGLTTIDYPGVISSVVFTGGCNMRCSYCHNREIAFYPQNYPAIHEDDIITKLKQRRNFIDGLVVSGGEPTIQPGLIPFLVRVREETGLKIKLDTNGSSPAVVAEVIAQGLVHYIAMDIKTSPGRYAHLVKIRWGTVLETINILRSAEVPYEFRTTCAPDYIDDEALREICLVLRPAEKLFLQPLYRASRLVSEPEELERYRAAASTAQAAVLIR